MAWLARAVQFGGTASIGYFFNDIANWVAGLVGADKVTNKERTGFAWWFVVALSLALGLVVYFVFKLLSGKKKLLSWAIFLSLVSIQLLGLDSDFSCASIIFTIAASSTETKSITYCPAFISFEATTVPTSFTIEVEGDGVPFRLDGTGLTNLNGLRMVGALPANRFVYQIADGFILKNTSFTVANAVAGTLTVHGFSQAEGTMYINHLMAKSFANASLDIRDFSYAAFPSAAATDVFTVTWASGKTQQMVRHELESLLGWDQDVTATRYNLDNYQRKIKAIQFIGAADQTVYYTRFGKAEGVINQSLG